MNRALRLQQQELEAKARLRDLPDARGARLVTLLGRALRRRCPLCGASGIFKNWFTLEERCPRCAYQFEREDGYFLGAYALNLIVAEMIPIALLVALFVWSSLSWITLELILIPLAVGLPFLLFPYARMAWMVLDLTLTPTNQR